MLFHGISAEGAVDLKSSILSGTLKTSSAGLYICFFALFIIVFVLVSLLTPSKERAPGAKSRAARLMPMFWGLLAAIGLCTVGGALSEGGARTIFQIGTGFLFMPLVAVVTAMIRMTANEDA